MSEDSLGVWGYRHFVIYLTSLVYRVHPRPKEHVKNCIEQLNHAAVLDKPFDAHPLKAQPPEGGRARLAAKMTNAICDVVHLWWRDANARTSSRTLYEKAKDAARDVERLAFNAGVPMETLLECAAVTFHQWDSLDNLSRYLSGRPIPAAERERRDAAVAAMEVGHYDVAYNILTRE